MTRSTIPAAFPWFCIAILAGCGSGFIDTVSADGGNIGDAKSNDGGTLDPGAGKLTSIAVKGSGSSIVEATQVQFTASGNYQNGTSKDLTNQATWSSSAPNVATVDKGLVRGIVAGTASISASYEGITGLFQLTVTATAIGPAITKQPQSVSVLAGQTVTFSVEASGTAPLSYQWRKNGENVGSNSASYVLTAASNDDGAKISVIVSNGAGRANSNEATLTVAKQGTVRIAYLHHSTGGNVWGGGVPEYISSYNSANSTSYQITSITYPDTSHAYPWANYPYDYWNLWVNHTGDSQDRGELNLDQIAASYDVIVFKHCFPVSGIEDDSVSSPPSVSSSAKTVANYKLQYQALKQRMKQFTEKKFIVWTGAALIKTATDEAKAQRAQNFFTWVKDVWDEKGDNIFVWDFYSLETEGSLYMNSDYATGDSHPTADFSKKVAPYIGKRMVDVIEGRGDSGSLTGN